MAYLIISLVISLVGISLTIYFGRVIGRLSTNVFATILLSACAACVVALGESALMQGIQVFALSGYPLVAIVTALIVRRSRTRGNRASQSAHANRRQARVTSSSSSMQKPQREGRTEILNEKGDEEFWSAADHEFKYERNQGLWVKCLYANGQDEVKAQTDYVQKRVEQMRGERETEALDEKKRMELEERGTQAENRFLNFIFIFFVLPALCFVVAVLLDKLGI